MTSTELYETSQWHSGEYKIQRLLAVPYQENPTQNLLSMGATRRFSSSPLVAIGALDSRGRPWATVWGGAPGVSEALPTSMLGIRSEVDARYDPVVEALFTHGEEGSSVEIVDGQKIGGRDVLVSGLAIDLERRLRWKMAGKMVWSSMVELQGYDDENVEHESKNVRDKPSSDEQARTHAQMIVRVEQSLGNCPKYLNCKTIRPNPITDAELVSSTTALCPGAIASVQKADVFFVSSINGNKDMDINHRGGPPGFVRVISPATISPATEDTSMNVNESQRTPTQLIWPEYSGNRLYQTLGNLAVTPQAGLVFPDFTTGDVLYVTGDTEILIGKDASIVLPRSNLAVRVTITGARFVKRGLPFRGTDGEASPYNPKVRLLASETIKNSQSNSTRNEQGQITATLIAQIPITPTISRFRFGLTSTSEVSTWKPGQWVALDFSAELDDGYSHMRDDDPRSLNDDFIRTFTISSVPPVPSSRNVEFEITIRKVGTVTGWLFRQNPRAGVELLVKGFGGDEEQRIHIQSRENDEEDRRVIPFVASGVGITPLLPQLPLLDCKKLRVFWSVQAADMDLVTDTMQRSPEWLGKCMTIFVTTREELQEESQLHIQEVTKMVKSVKLGRMSKDYLLEDEEVARAKKWYLCTGTGLRDAIFHWFEAEKDGIKREVVFEDFGF